MAGDRGSQAKALIDLAQFEQRVSPSGQLQHYARSRIGSFWLRQTLTFFGSVTIGLLASGRLGVALAIIALAGEIVDIACLRYVVRRMLAGAGPAWPYSIALAAAALQSGTIAICVSLCWRMIPVQEVRFFAAAFLIAATINAGVTRPHLRAAADVRLAIFALTGFVMMAMDLRQTALATSLEYGFFAAGFGLLAFISLLFIQSSERNYLQRRHTEYVLLKHQHDQHRVQIELALTARDNQRLALVAKYAKDSVILASPDGRIEWVNDAFTRITGHALEEVLGRMPIDFLNAPGTDPDTITRLTAARDAHQPVRAEVLNRTKSGHLIWMETSITPLFDDAGQLQLWISVERDIAEAKEREAELARAHAAAEEAGRAKTRFLANMSHEIRTPMNGVIGVAELLSETKLSPLQHDYVETIRDSGRMLLEIINDILDLAKFQSGKSALESRAFSLTGAVEAVMQILQPVAAKKALDLQLVLPGDVTLVGEEGKLRQILLNLIGNAVKFTREGAVTVTVRPPSGTCKALEIDVADTGIGIAPDRIGRIFDSFSQADDGIARQFGGTGLGLTICAMLAERMGGAITVRSNIGNGSVFTFRADMPRATAAAAIKRFPAHSPCARACA